MASRLTDEAWERARVLWESDPVMSATDLALMVNISKQAVSKRINRHGWKKISDQGELASRAYDRADAAIIAEQKKEKKTEQAPVEPGALASVSATIIDTAVELRARVIERHRKEWDGARNNVYKAIQNNDFEKAKLGKITAEALAIIQGGERKAWGFDKDDQTGGGKMTVTINRGEKK